MVTPAAQVFIKEWLDPSTEVIHAHTSGSTGAPKPVELLKADMRASARATLRFFGLGKGSLLLLPLSPDYIAGKMQIVRALEGGCDLYVEEPSSYPFAFDARHTAAVCFPPRPAKSMAAIVPAQAEALMQNSVFESIDIIIIGGAPIAPDLEARLAATGKEIYATYGMTETCSHVALRRVGSELYQGLPGFTFSADSRGCLVIETTTMSFGRLVTNDCVELRSPTSFKWLGRADNVINSGGVKIHPEELERRLEHLVTPPCSLYVTSRPSTRWGEEAVVITDSPSLTHEDVVKALAGEAHNHLPKAVVRVMEIPRTASGKIIRQKGGEYL